MMKPDRLYLDIHVIQTVPPANINRDDTGSRDCGLRCCNPGRVSSQSWKGTCAPCFRGTAQDKQRTHAEDRRFRSAGDP